MGQLHETNGLRLKSTSTVELGSSSSSPIEFGGSGNNKPAGFEPIFTAVNLLSIGLSLNYLEEGWQVIMLRPRS